jgi:hypothetical protein
LDGIHKHTGGGSVTITQPRMKFRSSNSTILNVTRDAISLDSVRSTPNLDLNEQLLNCTEYIEHRRRELNLLDWGALPLCGRVSCLTSHDNLIGGTLLVVSQVGICQTRSCSEIVE